MRKKNIINLTVLIKEKPGLFAARLVLFAAFCAFMTGCWLYWKNEGSGAWQQSASRPMSRASMAEGMRMSADVLAAVLSKEAERSGGNDAAMAEALTRIYPELSESGYFVLWRGTVGVCSPLTPDTAGLDFGNQRDAGGAYFVRELEKIARAGGGFYNFTLVYDVPLGSAASARGFDSQFLAYSTPVQGTALHLTLWRPVDQASFSLQAELEEDSGNWSLLGLCMAGLSFLGVSVLLRGFKAN